MPLTGVTMYTTSFIHRGTKWKTEQISDSARKEKSNQRWEVVRMLARKVDLQFSFGNHNSKNIMFLRWSSHPELCYLCYSQISSLHHCIILGVLKKLLHKSEGKSAPKKEDDLAESWKLGTWVTASWFLFLRKNIFLFLIDIADTAIWMSNFDNFDIGQMSSKFAQIQYFSFKTF